MLEIKEISLIFERCRILWCANMTYIETQAGGWCYLSTIMGLHSKMIIGYSFGKTMDTDLVLRTLNQMVGNQAINDQLILHIDQGTQYTSKNYQERLAELGIQHSFSRKGCPYDNAEIESFHATLKKKLVYQCPIYPSFEAAKASLFDYVFRFYNRQRIHSARNRPKSPFNVINTAQNNLLWPWFRQALKRFWL